MFPLEKADKLTYLPLADWFPLSYLDLRLCKLGALIRGQPSYDLLVFAKKNPLENSAATLYGARQVVIRTQFVYFGKGDSHET